MSTPSRHQRRHFPDAHSAPTPCRHQRRSVGVSRSFLAEELCKREFGSTPADTEDYDLTNDEGVIIEVKSSQVLRTGNSKKAVFNKIRPPKYDKLILVLLGEKVVQKNVYLGGKTEAIIVERLTARFGPPCRSGNRGVNQSRGTGLA